MDSSIEKYNAADHVIRSLLACGHDYTSKREQIAEAFDESLWEGNWDTSIDFDDGTPTLRLIQEDEYEQHMDDDEKPEPTAEAYSHYLFVE